MNANTNRIYVTNRDSGTVSVIDGAANTVVATVPVRYFSISLGLNASTNRIYVANANNNSVNVIDGATNTVTATIPVEAFPVAVGVNASTNRIYVGNRDSNSVSVIDGSSNTVVASLPVSRPIGIGVNASTNRIYIARLSNDVVIIDGVTHAVIATVPVGAAPLGVAVNPNTSRVYVANSGSNTVSVIEDIVIKPTAAPQVLQPLTPTPIPPARPCVTAEFDSAVGIRADIPPNIASIDNTPVNICYAPLTDPVQYGVSNRSVLLAAEIIAFTKTEPPISTTRLNQPITVCLRGSGSLLYRDAAGAPRVVTSAPNVSSVGGYTCAAIRNVGTLILVADGGTNAASVNPQVVAETPLAQCRVITRNITNLRETPTSTGTVLDTIPPELNLQATARAGDWIKVVFGNRQGFVSATIVELIGSCG